MFSESRYFKFIFFCFVEKIIEKEVIKEDPRIKHPRVQEAIKHAKRSGELE